MNSVRCSSRFRWYVSERSAVELARQDPHSESKHQRCRKEGKQEVWFFAHKEVEPKESDGGNDSSECHDSAKAMSIRPATSEDGDERREDGRWRESQSNLRFAVLPDFS